MKWPDCLFSRTATWIAGIATAALIGIYLVLVIRWL